VLNPKTCRNASTIPRCSSPEAREELHDIILVKALAVGIAFASAPKSTASISARRRFSPCDGRSPRCPLRPAYAIIDGNDLPPDLCCQGAVIVKGDAQSLSIAAASIVAKVTRDRLMRRLHHHHPLYGFARHVGYATREHLRAIEAHGPCPFHR